MRKSQEILFHTRGFRYIEIFYQYTMGQRVLFITLKTSFYEVPINKGYTVLLRNLTREVPNVFTYYFWIHDSETVCYSFFLQLRLYPLIFINLDYFLFHIYLNIFISANFPLPSFCIVVHVDYAPSFSYKNLALAVHTILISDSNRVTNDVLA